MIGATAIKPVERHGLEALSWFLYDKNTGAIMGRSLESWAKITIFYIIYYTFLAGFWLLMLFVFFQFIDDNNPRWTMKDSLIGESPALGVRPGQEYDLIDSSMIMWRADVADVKKDDVVPGYGGWVKRTNDFLEPYRTNHGNGKDCSTEQPVVGEFCKFNLDVLEECAQSTTNYGYSAGAPCLLIKLNKIFGLIPTYYEDEAALPGEAPREIADRMKLTQNKRQVWIHCQGENTFDKENLGPIEYFPPHGGFPDTYFPYLNEDGYQSPLVAVKLSNVTEGHLIHLECRAWAGNIKYDKRDRLGRVHMEIMLHSKDTATRVNNVAKGLVDPPVKPRKNN